MAQPPSFPFYPGDYLLGTLSFTLAEDGAYLRCLMHQWSSGEGVPGDDVPTLARILRVPPAEARKIWESIGYKFERGEDGLYRNARLEKQRDEKRQFHESAAKRGKQGASKRWLKHGRAIAEPSVSHDVAINQPIANDGSSLSLSSVPTEQRETRPRAGYRDPFGFRRNPADIATALVSETQQIGIPASWWERASKDRGLPATDDADRFALWLAYEVRGGVVVGANKLRWLDEQLARYVASLTAPVSSYPKASDWLAKQQAAMDAALAEDSRG